MRQCLLWWRVQPVNATPLVVYRQAFQSPRSSLGVGSGAVRSCSNTPASRPIDPCLLGSTDAAIRWCSHCCRAAKGCAGRRSTPARRWRIRASAIRRSALVTTAARVSAQRHRSSGCVARRHGLGRSARSPTQASAYWALGRHDKAHEISADLKRNAPAYRLANWNYLSSIRRPEVRDRVYALMRDAGIPE